MPQSRPQSTGAVLPRGVDPAPAEGKQGISLHPPPHRKRGNEAEEGNVNDCKTAGISYTADNNPGLKTPETVD